jgi:hypothetical protein
VLSSTAGVFGLANEGWPAFIRWEASFPSNAGNLHLIVKYSVLIIRYTKLESKFMENRPFTTDVMMPSETHTAILYNEMKNGRYAGDMKLSEMTNIVSEMANSREKLKRESKYIRREDGTYCEEEVAAADPEVVNVTRLISCLKVHANAIEFVGLGKAEAFLPHINCVEECKEQWASTRAKELGDAEAAVRKLIQTTYRRNGGDLTAAVKEVYSNHSMGKKYWDKMLHHVDPEKTYKKKQDKEKEKDKDSWKGKGKGKGGKNRFGDYPLRSDWWSQSDPGRDNKTWNTDAGRDAKVGSIAQVESEHGISWWDGFQKVCYDFNLKSEGCPKDAAKCFSHVCCVCKKADCRLLEHKDAAAALMTAKGKGKGKSSKKGGKKGW